MTTTAVVDRADAAHDDTSPGLPVGPETVEVGRRTWLAAVLGVAAAGVAIAYLSRASRTGAALDWALTLALATLAAAHLRSLVDGRRPLLLADEQGARIRLGRSWTGLPWAAVSEVSHRPRRGWRDGRLVVHPRDLARLLAELDGGGRRQAAWSTRLYGAPLALPLGLATRVRGTSDLSEALLRLSGGSVPIVREPVVEEPVLEQEPAEAGEGAEESGATLRRRRWLRDPRPLLAAGIGRLSHDASQVEEPAAASDTPVPARAPRPARRTEITRNIPRDRPEPDSEPGSDSGRGPGATGRDARVRSIVTSEEQLESPVVDEFVVQPAEDPVIGPELRTARTRLGLSVDQLADRTRIRPHVIESIEVDDFAPCGGDFYARGHLRTLARVLGVDAGPLLAAHEERYAAAPVDPRRVFEAEMATGFATGSRRSTGGGGWSLLLAAVMTVVLAWSVARLVADDPAPAPQPWPLGGSQPASRAPDRLIAEPVRLALAASGPVRVVVQDGSGRVVLTKSLGAGERVRLQVEPPVRVAASDGGLVSARLDGEDQGAVGEAGGRATARYQGA